MQRRGLHGEHLAVLAAHLPPTAGFDPLHHVGNATVELGPSHQSLQHDASTHGDRGDRRRSSEIVGSLALAPTLLVSSRDRSSLDACRAPCRARASSRGRSGGRSSFLVRMSVSGSASTCGSWYVSARSSSALTQTLHRRTAALFFSCACVKASLGRRSLHREQSDPALSTADGGAGAGDSAAAPGAGAGGKVATTGASDSALAACSCSRRSRSCRSAACAACASCCASCASSSLRISSRSSKVRCGSNRRLSEIVSPRHH